MAFRGSLCVLELSMTPYNHVGMRSLSRIDHTGRQWQLPELSALSEKKLLLKKTLVSVGHPVGVGAPGTGVARKVAPPRPLGFPTGT